MTNLVAHHCSEEMEASKDVFLFSTVVFVMPAQPRTSVLRDSFHSTETL